MTRFWEREHLLLASVPAKHSTYVVGDAEEEPTMWVKSGVQHAVMDKQPS